VKRKKKMNTKRKGEKGKGGIKIGIALTAIMVVSIFAAIAPVTTALEHTIAKHSLEYEGGPINDTKTYIPGNTVYYLCEYTPNSEAVWLKKITDNYPDGSSAVLFSGNVSVAQGETYIITTNWTIPLSWSASTINNQVVFNITSQLTGLNDEGTASQQNTVILAPPIFNFTWEQICCKNISFTGWTSKPGEIANHTWYFGDGIEITKNGDPGVISHNYSTTTGCGEKTVTLEGYDIQGNYNYSTKDIYVDCGPTAIVAPPPCFKEGGMEITFDGSASHVDLSNPNPRSITWWKWTFSDGQSGDHDSQPVTSRWVNDTVMATLEVSDGCCNDTTNVWVNPCPSRVPAITPIGIIALIGLVSVIAAISINMNKRKRK